jgi:hypothetical protein
MIQNADGFEGIRTLEDRLLQRDCVSFSLHICCQLDPMHLAQFLSMNESVLSGHSFLCYLVKQVEAIKFVTDWWRKGLRAGGKKI